ncbi:MAG: zf-HC2 domain-containing protein [Anaerolineales bacterium]|nr:zf-HC2 domain-containing protein [Anaerolineales bacterium]MCA9978464.1 zf-HC2 domain-containing protein [Anaerolineales bacterium]
MSQHGECRHLLDDLSLYLDGDASEAVCAEIEQHLSECDNCRVMVDTLSKTIYLYQNLPQPTLPDAMRERLYKKLDLAEFLEK